MKSGVYKITNLVTGKIYIGSAKNIHNRWKRHMSYLRRGAHENILLQRAFNKHGEINFTMEVLEFCNVEDCVTREQFYIDTYTPTKIDIGYNICPQAASVLGRRMTEEAKIRIGNANRGKKKSTDHRAALSAAQSGKKRKPLSEECKHKIRLTRLGKKASPETRKKLSESHKGKIQTPDLIAKRVSKLSRPVQQYDLNGNFLFEYPSIKEAAQKIGCRAPSVSQNLSGKADTCMGFRFKYAKK